ncbi:E-selectin precursor [Gracilaria domingensis]|nr:E-selectin precursor [Gracilaria domingensis]
MQSQSCRSANLGTSTSPPPNVPSVPQVPIKASRAKTAASRKTTAAAQCANLEHSTSRLVISPYVNRAKEIPFNLYRASPSALTVRATPSPAMVPPSAPSALPAKFFSKERNAASAPKDSLILPVLANVPRAALAFSNQNLGRGPASVVRRMASLAKGQQSARYVRKEPRSRRAENVATALQDRHTIRIRRHAVRASLERSLGRETQ